MPSATGLTASRWDGLAVSVTSISVPLGAAKWPVGAEVVLDVARALRAARVDVALELVEDLRVGLADDVGEHVEPAAVRHADDDLVEPVVGGLGERRVEQRDDRLGALRG